MKICTQQQGFSVLALIITLMLLALMMILAFSTLQQTQLRQLIADHRYYADYHLAASSLAWGEQLVWQNSDNWQCQQLKHQQDTLQACFKYLPQQQLALLKSEIGEVALYRLYQINDVDALQQLSQLQAVWLDYCPLSPEICHDEPQ